MGKIIRDKGIMGGKPIVEGTRCTVNMIRNMDYDGYDAAALIRLYPYLTHEDIKAALTYNEGDIL